MNLTLIHNLATKLKHLKVAVFRWRNSVGGTPRDDVQCNRRTYRHGTWNSDEYCSKVEELHSMSTENPKIWSYSVGGWVADSEDHCPKFWDLLKHWWLSGRRQTDFQKFEFWKLVAEWQTAETDIQKFEFSKVVVGWQTAEFESQKFRFFHWCWWVADGWVWKPEIKVFSLIEAGGRR